MHAILNPEPCEYDNVCQSRGSVWFVDGNPVAVIDYSDNGVGETSLGETDRALWFIDGVIVEGANGSPVVHADVVEMLMTDAASVARQFWGNYFILIYDKRSEKFIVCSDPCGQRPVFYRIGAGRSLRVSETIAAFIRCGGERLEPDLQYVGQYLAYGLGDVGKTGWRDIALLPPGMALEWRRGASLRLLHVWSPSDHRTSKSSHDFIEMLTTVLRVAVGEERRIFLELSGGLDSTAIAVALMHAGLNRRATALTYFDPWADSSNEVALARRVASYCGIAHRTLSLLDCLPFSPVVPPILAAKPSTRLCFLPHGHHVENEVFQGNGGVVLSGHGGDSICLDRPPFGTLIDTAINFRLRSALAALKNLSIQYRIPIWLTLRRALADASQRCGGAYAQGLWAILAKPGRVRSTVSAFDKCLTSPCLWLRPGRRAQIAGLAAIIDDALVQSHPAGGRTVMPFLSQPIVERALSWPLDEIFSADHSRLPVRMAAYRASRLPNVWRRDKGDIMHSALLGINVNIDHVRETCLEGWCASHDLIDTIELDRLIKRSALGYSSGLVGVSRVYATEMFVRAMTEA